MSERRIMGPRVSEAIGYAAETHAGQLRKGTDIPYIAHLLSVAALVIDDGGTEDQAIAALLHDAAEDQGGEERLADIRERFGDDVARMVEECSDTLTVPKPPWRERKERYLAHLQEASDDALLISLADKLDNARALLRDCRDLGQALWERFNERDPAQHLWYYRSLVAVYERRSQSWMVAELRRTVAELDAEVAESGPGASPQERLARLDELYGEMHELARQRDPETVRRVIEPRSLESGVFLISPAIARDSQRYTGLPYVRPDGALNRSGQTLDAFLARFGYTIDPGESERRYAYHADIVCWFAGEEGEGGGDGPSDEELELCWGFLERQIDLVAPRVVIALGLPAARQLLSHGAGVPLTAAGPRLDELVGVEHRAIIAGRSLPALVVHHPSGAFQHPNSGAVYRATAERIARMLEES